jgi:hypothetical protein
MTYPYDAPLRSIDNSNFRSKRNFVRNPILHFLKRLLTIIHTFIYMHTPIIPLLFIDDVQKMSVVARKALPKMEHIE